MKRTTSILCILAILLSAASCAGKSSVETVPDLSPKAVTDTVETVTENTVQESGVLETFVLDGRDVPILEFKEPTNLSVDLSESTGDTMNDAIFLAHQAVMERLQCNLAFIDNGGIETGKLETTYAAGEDAYSLVIGTQWKVAPLVSKHMFANLNPDSGGSSVDNYIDLSKPWWYTRYIDETEVDNSHTYFLAGDASINVMRRASMLVCNMDLLHSIGGDIDALYDNVLSGNWLWDDFATMVEGVYIDNNGDGKKDAGDTFGYATWTRSDVDHLMVDSGIRACARDDSGVPYLAFNNEKTIASVEKVCVLLWKNPGGYYKEQIPVDTMLGENRLLFVVNKFSGLDSIRDIGTNYTIIPVPKLDASIGNYSSLVHDDAMIFCVPIQSTQFTATTAVLEEMSCQYYNDVIPTYYNVILKAKYRRDGSDKASQIMDILHDSMTTDFAYTYNYAMGNMIISLRDLIGIKRSTDFVSHYAKNEMKYEDSLAKLIDAIRE